MRYLLFLVLFLSACDPCARLDCAYSDYDGQFRIVRASDGSDLLFGSQKLYAADSLRFYTVKGSDTTVFQSSSAYLPGSGYDSILQVRFFPQADTAYMQLPNGDVDTLTMAFETIPSRCCGTRTNITAFRLNDAAALPGDGTQIIRK